MSQQSVPPDEEKTLTNLFLSIFIKFLLGAVTLGLLIFLTAWTLNYWQAWTFIVLFMALLTLYSSYFSIKDPALMERRKLNVRQIKIYIWCAYILEIGTFVISALDHRFGWSHMPPSVSILGDVLVALAIVIWYFSKRENSYAGAAIKIYEGHMVITTGPYALIRHPSYVGDMTLILGISMALGSWWALILFALHIPVIVWMIFDEEQFLKKNLPGYTEYMQKVHSRMIPKIW